MNFLSFSFYSPLFLTNVLSILCMRRQASQSDTCSCFIQQYVCCIILCCFKGCPLLQAQGHGTVSSLTTQVLHHPTNTVPLDTTWVMRSDADDHVEFPPSNPEHKHKHSRGHTKKVSH